MTGTTWIEEVGALSMPIGITNTHSIGAVHEGIVAWTVEHHPRVGVQWMLPVAAETWDGYLNDINGRPREARAHDRGPRRGAAGPVANGSVGGGTGHELLLVQGRHGDVVPRGAARQHRRTPSACCCRPTSASRAELRVAGRAPRRRLLADDNPMHARPTGSRATSGAPASRAPAPCIVIVATDAPLLPGQCKALARRVPLGPRAHRHRRAATSAATSSWPSPPPTPARCAARSP
jgi:D-aminopeptidase